MKKFFYTISAVCFIFIFYSPSFSQTISQLSFFAPLISTFDGDYQNDHLFITQQNLLVIDVSDPEQPENVGQASYPGNYAYQIAADGNHVYMAMGNGGIFAVYDVSNVSTPVLTGSVAIPTTSFLLTGDIAPHGNYVYMSGFDSLYVIDVSNATAPQVIHRQEIADVGFGGAGAMAIINESLLITTPFALQVFAISDPANPILTGSYTNSHSSQKGIAVDTVTNRVFLPWISTLATHMGYDAIDLNDPSLQFFYLLIVLLFGGGDFGETAYYSNILIIQRVVV
jgi:hypothetical protein